MTPEKQLEHAYSIAAALLDRCEWAEKDPPKDWLNKYLNSKSELCEYVPGLAAVAALAEDAREQLLKKSCGSATPAIKRMIKNVSDARPDVKGWWKDVEGRACICDGYRAIRLNGDIKGIAPIPAPAFDMDRAMAKPEGISWAVLDLPTVNELKECIAAQRARGEKSLGKSGTTYDFGDGLPMVDAMYLLDMMLIFPDVKQARTRDGYTSQIIYFDSERGDGILLPVHKRSA